MLAKQIGVRKNDDGDGPASPKTTNEVINNGTYSWKLYDHQQSKRKPREDENCSLINANKDLGWIYYDPEEAKKKKALEKAAAQTSLPGCK